ncbi:MAG: autotransporter domain-containing protein, partial [Roseiarcus sp.]
ASRRAASGVAGLPGALPAALAILGAAAALTAWPREANAACVVTTGGDVNCKVDTKTSTTTNFDGASSVSSDRTQLFNNGSPIDATIRKGVTVSGSGLDLFEGDRAGLLPRPITMNNEGQVISSNPFGALELDGNGGAVTYTGNGGVANSNRIGVGLSVADQGGAVSITTGAGAIKGATGILASDAYAGALTITTGSGLVSGGTGAAISASTAKGALSITIGSGGVTTGSNVHAIDATSTDGAILIKATGNVAGGFRCAVPPDTPQCYAGGVQAISRGSGNITVDGSGAYSASSGRAIWADQSATGLGGVLVTGSGPTLTGTPAFGNASAIRAQISNPADSSNIVVNRSGDITGIDTFPADNKESISADIHALTVGSGNITVATGAGATLSNAGMFGIDVSAYGRHSTGSINVSTGAFGSVTVNGAGIFAVNAAFAIPASAASTISVTNNGVINSGAILNPVGNYFGDGGAATATPAGIIAGYSGGPVSGPASGRYTSCGPLGCTTLTPNPNVDGTVIVVNNGAINAGGGDGILAFNFGDGAVSVLSTAAITVTGATARNGIAAFSAELGDITVSTTANVIAGGGDGIRTTSAGVGTTTINMGAGVVEGAAGGVAAASASGPILIDNSGTIQNLSRLPGALAVATSGAGDAILVNAAGGVVIGAVAMTGGGTNSFVNAGLCDTRGASSFAGVGSIVNSGVLDVLGPTSFDGSTRLSNGGVLDLAAGRGVDTLHVAGDVGFRPGSTYIVGVNAAGRSDALVVSGKARLAGGTVDVQATPGTFTPASHYTILTASGGVSGHFASLAIDPDFAFVAPELTYAPTRVTLGFAQAAPFASAAATPNQLATASAIQAQGSGAPLYGALLGQSVTGARAAFDALSGEIHPSAVSAAFDDARLPREAVLDRLASPYGAPGGGATGFSAMSAIVGPTVPANVFAAWGQAFGSFGHVGGDGDAATLDRSMGGFILGLDATLDQRYRLGVAAGYTQSILSLDARDSSGNVDSTFGGVYGGASLEALQLRGGAFYAYNRYGADRTIAFPGFGDTASSGYGGDTLQAFGEAGWRMPVSGFAGPTFVEPYAGALAMHIDTASFAEAGGASALSGAAAGYDYGATTLGLRGETAVFAGAPLFARAMLGWQHVFGAVTPGSTLAFESAPAIPFSVAGAPVARDALLVEAGFDWRLSANASIGVFYSGALAAHDQDNAIKGRFQIAF